MIVFIQKRFIRDHEKLILVRAGREFFDVFLDGWRLHRSAWTMRRGFVRLTHSYEQIFDKRPGYVKFEVTYTL